MACHERGLPVTAQTSVHPKAASFQKVSSSWLSGILGTARKAVTHPVVGATIATTAIPLLAQAVGSHIQGRRDAKSKAESFRTMIGMHRGLKNYDPIMVSRVYNSIHNVNPMMANDPLVAGSLVENVLNSGDIMQSAGVGNLALIATIKDLASVRNQVSGSSRNEAGAGLGTQFGATARALVDNAQSNYREVDRQHGLQKQLDDFKAHAKDTAEIEKQKRVADRLMSEHHQMNAASRAMAQGAEAIRQAGGRVDPGFMADLQQSIADRAEEAAMGHKRSALSEAIKAY